jgi:hypothetical protein
MPARYFWRAFFAPLPKAFKPSSCNFHKSEKKRPLSYPGSIFIVGEDLNSHWTFLNEGKTP